MGKKGGGAKGKSKASTSTSTSSSSSWEKEGSEESWGLGWKLLVCFLAIAFGIIQRNHAAGMFERDRHFSHLSDLEREMTFRTEMGLYYSYFKTFVTAPSMSQGLQELIHDNVSEFGHTINTLKRFNLYPELVMGAAYRAYMGLAKWMGWRTTQCWETNRGEGLQPILSCEGMGNQFYFYINLTFALSGAGVAVLFVYGVLLSDSLMGGLLVMSGFFFNHGEATRVQWTPPLRESFGYPIWAAQMLLVSFILKRRLSGCGWSLAVAVCTTSFMLPWQFASFAISTQISALFATHALDKLPLRVLRCLLLGHWLGWGLGYLLLFGNEMLMSSLYLACLVSLSLLYIGGGLVRRISCRPIFLILYVCLYLGLAIGFKVLVGELLDVKDDAHIFEILRSKFTDFRNFHTSLYTCAVEFDFLETATYVKLGKTLLLPSTIVAVVALLALIWTEERGGILWRRREGVGLNYSAQLYNLIQAAAFTLMAVLIMRLKLFWTPHLCLLCSLLAWPPLLPRSIFNSARIRHAFLVALIAASAVVGYSNLQHQWSIMGEYSNVPQEELFEWIVSKTGDKAVFAGPMPTMANIKLSTLRPIINHPHYEDTGLRERTMKVYSIFSRKPLPEVHSTLKEMGANFVVFESGWCGRGPKPGCSMQEIWDHVDPSNSHRPSNCDVLKGSQHHPFQLAYSNSNYRVFRV